MGDQHDILESLERLGQLLDRGDAAELESFLASLPSGETAYTISRLPEDSRTRLLEQLPAEVAADLMEALSDAQAADLIEELPAERAAAIVDRMASDEQVDLLSELDHEDAEAILERMTPEEAEDVRRLTKYGPDTAGGIMNTEFLVYSKDMTVDQVVQDLRQNADRYSAYDVQYVYLVERETGRLEGNVRIRDLLLTPGTTPITTIILTPTYSVLVDADLDQLADYFDRHGFYAAPVLDGQGRLVGVVRRAHVEESLAERADKVMLRIGGIIGGEELRTMPLLERSGRRLAFLAPNIGLNLIAVSVIAFYEPLLAKVSALMIFLPILSDMSGCSGNQAVAVSMRELSLGLVKPFEVLRVLSKEAAVGLINGVILGVILGVITWMMRGHVYPYLGLVVGLAMAANSLIAVCLGGTIPLILKALKTDPALASSPLLTTVTDLCGFFLALSFVQIMLNMTGTT